MPSYSSQRAIHSESACYNHTSLSDFLFPTRCHTMQRAQKSSIVSHSPSLISLSIYKRLFPLLWAVSVIFQLPRFQSDPVSTNSTQAQKKKKKKILEGIFQVRLLANGQPEECAYKIKIKKCVLIYIHQALRT